MFRIMCCAAVLIWSATASAQTCNGCVAPTGSGSPISGLTSSIGGRPQVYDITGTTSAHCRLGLRYCVVAEASRNRVSLYVDGRGVLAYDAVMRSWGRTIRGPLVDIDPNPSWCPTPGQLARANVRAVLAEARATGGASGNCLLGGAKNRAGQSINPMGAIKWIMGGDFSGTLYRLHGTPGFSHQWVDTLTDGCARLLNDGIGWLSSQVVVGHTEVVFTD